MSDGSFPMAAYGGARNYGKTAQSEAAFQDAVIELAKLTGWLVYHTHDSRHSAAGFPDLVLARDGDLIFAELKSDTGKVTAEQQRWIDVLNTTANAAVVWRPANWGVIERRLKAR